MQSLKTKHVLFLGEQDGAGERELKSKLVECFSNGAGVELAFLARVSFSEVPAPQVALCVKGDKKYAQSVVDCVGRIFATLFKTTQHLDILYLTDLQVPEIKRVASPFYQAAS